ncbi:MAG: N-formylglutamate amidohydrolase [Pseudomonadota bacterium]
MVETAHAPLLTETELPAAEVLNPQASGDLVLVCEHASAAIPAELGTLGLPEPALAGHWAWDIGALDVARAMAVRLHAPLVVSRVSRLVYDCNRPPTSPTAIVEVAEHDPVTGNRGLSEAARRQRVEDVYHPFRDLLAETLETRAPRALVNVHSFTPIYFGTPRVVELGFLHDDDAALAEAMLRLAEADPRWVSRLNEPYDASDGVTHTLRTQAIPRGISNAMIEIRSDLIDTRPAAQGMAAYLSDILRRALAEVPG